MTTRRARRVLLGVGALALLVLVLTPAGAGAVTLAAQVSHDVLSAFDAIVLGIVEGITEYLPISSTGHLLVTARILDLPTSGAAGDAVKSYEIAIQFGAILAVLALYRHRVWTMVEGLVGRSDDGRRVLIAVAIAFVPAAVVGVVSEKAIKDVLFGTWPVVVAWIVGGVAVIVLSRMGKLGPQRGRGLTELTTRDALIIGGAQVLALWPGTSRSLVTIVAALLIGVSMEAAVEFSFLLGFVTLSAATLYTTAKDGQLMLDTFGLGTPLLGLVVAFVFAALAIKWMVSYLSHHDLAIFGWYRIAVAVLVIVLVATGAI
ncbi:MAG: undecaprenyl-diphosphate phosphatase [Acidimicrobiia bacterium]